MIRVANNFAMGRQNLHKAAFLAVCCICLDHELRNSNLDSLLFPLNSYQGLAILHVENSALTGSQPDR